MHLRTIAAKTVDQTSEAERIALRRRILNWRDAWSMEAEARLSKFASEKANGIATWANGLRAYQLAAARTGMADFPDLPGFIEEASKLANMVVANAHRELTSIVAHHLEIEARAGRAQPAKGISADQVLEIGRGVAPLAAAATLLAALPALATTTTVSFFGLITTSSVSLPVLAAGAAGVGVLGYFGVINVGDLRTRQERILIEAIEGVMEAQLLAPDTEGKDHSLLARLHKGFADAATSLIEEIA